MLLSERASGKTSLYFEHDKLEVYIGYILNYLILKSERCALEGSNKQPLA